MINIQFCLGESIHSTKVVDYMMAVDINANPLLDDDGDFLLYAEVEKSDSEFDEDGNEINPFIHRKELKAEILRQAAEKDIPAFELRF